MKTTFKTITATAFAKDSDSRVEAIANITANHDAVERSYRAAYTCGYRVGHYVSPDSKDKKSLLSPKNYGILMADIAAALDWMQTDVFLADSTMAEFCKAQGLTKAEYKDKLWHKRRAILINARKNTLQKMRDGLDRAEKALNPQAYDRRKKIETKKSATTFDPVKVCKRISALIDLIETAGDGFDVKGINTPLTTAYNLLVEEIAKH